jgi:DNA-binding LacI/PurR family transcriptional regulator
MTKNKQSVEIFYKTIQEDIKNKIISGELKPGDRIPSERKLCDIYSASRTTIRKAIDELVANKYLIRKHGKGTFVFEDYLSEREKTGNILFIRCIHDTDNTSSPLSAKDIFSEILSGIEEAARKNNYHCLFNTVNIDKPDRRAISQLVSKVDGIIWGGELHNEEFLQYLLETKLPMVLVSPSIKVDYVDCVNIDNELGAYKGVKHLIENGHRKIACIAGSADSFPSRERRRGYEEALTEAGLEVDETLVLSYGWSYESGYWAMQELLKRKGEFSAVYAASDLLALGAISALKDASLNYPDDISIVGFDDIDIARQIKPSLTTLQIDKKNMGEVAVNLLFERLTGKRDYPLRVSLPTRLIKRKSVCKLK